MQAAAEVSCHLYFTSCHTLAAQTSLCCMLRPANQLVCQQLAEPVNVSQAVQLTHTGHVALQSLRYDRMDNTFRNMVDVQLVAAMGPPGGGRNPVTPRFVRHFVQIAINEFDDATYRRIYGAISEWWVDVVLSGLWWGGPWKVKTK